MDSRDLYSVKQAAEMLGCGTQSVIRMARSGELEGAFKLNPDKETSPWVVPGESVRAMKEKGWEKQPGTGRPGFRFEHQESVKRAAKLLGMSTSRVQALCVMGRLGKWEGGAWVIDDEDIQQFLEGRGRW